MSACVCLCKSSENVLSTTILLSFSVKMKPELDSTQGSNLQCAIQQKMVKEFK